MSGKLDQSLDDILSTQRRSAGGARRRSQRRSTGRPAAAAPVGGVQKTSKPARAAAAKPNAAKPTQGTGDSKVIVSNLPKDVSEQQIKEYFITSVGPIKRVEISYGPNSVSRGIANITFRDPDGASKAFNKLNGLLVDNRPIKIEIVVGASQAANVIPPKKTLAERTSQPKAQPKSAANNKRNNAAANKGPAAAAGRARGDKKPRPARSARPAKKTAEELDSEMADYFESGSTNNENAAAPAAAAATGDAPMEEDIM
ncbi:mRNA export protein mlo3 [Colletotrichum sidae]|uniref:mRNA export protein mlo3 n=4 Tax=Colletotrichum orbiculare species complex TaxID=2707354 RepID=N4W3C4_COLOR|nr:mRNA export protein mlo3 [Colletotrichum orbiculare MAFF 240422]TDZ37837.1 mRNA export protein mlo3 [Colletotrichum spinosum]TDZ74627.1 mRNA export protein mlo3 [Colletotrichum trifolii]TEA17451.1 mRNA export protein mlo3 [Colletotrichum sidae]